MIVAAVFLSALLCSSLTKGFASARAITRYKTTSIGPISIFNVSPDGKFITLENTSPSWIPGREINLKGWKLKNSVDDKRAHIYFFKHITLKPGKSIKIFARGAAAEAGENDLIFRNEESWGVGSKVSTSLLDDNGQEKATYTGHII